MPEAEQILYATLQIMNPAVAPKALAEQHGISKSDVMAVRELFGGNGGQAMPSQPQQQPKVYGQAPSQNSYQRTNNNSYPPPDPRFVQWFEKQVAELFPSSSSPRDEQFGIVWHMSNGQRALIEDALLCVKDYHDNKSEVRQPASMVIKQLSDFREGLEERAERIRTQGTQYSGTGGAALQRALERTREVIKDYQPGPDPNFADVDESGPGWDEGDDGLQ